MKKYIIVWLQLAHISFAQQLSTRFASLLFLVGKSSRFVFFMIFLVGIVNKTNGLADYSKDQVILFFLVFNLVDIITQFFFRGTYFFRQKVVSGEFDFYLLNPMHPLFRALANFTDPLDLITFFPLVLYFIWFLAHSSITMTLQSVILFFVMFILSFLVAFAFHVVVLAIGVITTEVDHTIMIYRDLTQMARIPIDLYAQPARIFLTYLIPIALMLTVPAKALMGLMTPLSVLSSLFFVLCFLFLSLRFWKYSLSQYSSASS